MLKKKLNNELRYLFLSVETHYERPKYGKQRNGFLSGFLACLIQIQN